MTGGQKRPELVSASATKHDRADDLLGAVVPSHARDYVGAPSPESDLSNVIPFAPRGRKAADKGTKAPAVECAIADRPAPNGHSKDRQRQIALLVGGSLLIHGVIFAAFNREPEPHASIGVISISADIVLGTQTNAGRSATPSESEGVESPYSPGKDEPADTRHESARRDVAKAPVEKPKETKREEVAAPKAQEPLRIETAPEPRGQAELVAEPKLVKKPALTPDQKNPEAKDTKKVREAARHAKEDGESKRDRAAPAAAPSMGSNSVGRGRSDLDSNYAGIVAAHLARFKQFPSDAQRRGEQGTAVVYFSISGSGGVTSVRLTRGSGIPSIDQEAVAMVRRASPFPAPPSGRTMAFTRPLIFQIK